MSDSRPPLPFFLDEMRLADIPNVMAIERRAFPQTWSSGIYRRELTANPFSHYRVLRPQTRELPAILAYGGIWQIDEEAHIPTLAVHPDYTGYRLGSYLLMHLLLLAIDLQCDAATLEVRETNLRAQDLYRRFGFQVAGRRRHYYRTPQEDALIMSRHSLVRSEIEADLALVSLEFWQVWSQPNPLPATSP